MISPRWLPILLGALVFCVSRSGATDAASVDALAADATASARRGDFATAARTWSDAAQRYADAHRPVQQSRALLNLSAAHLALGYPSAAIDDLERARRVLGDHGDDALSASILAGLGNAFVAQGAFEPADQALSEALVRARRSGQPDVTAAVLNDVGTLRAGQHQYAEARAAYAEAIDLATSAGAHLLAARAACNAADVALATGEYARARALLDEASTNARLGEAAHDQADALIGIARAADRLRPHLPAADAQLLHQEYDLLSAAANVAESIDDPRAGTYAWGYLGGLYETARRYPEALQLTRRAIFAAQTIDLPEALYRWQWQTGRILRAQGQLDAAIDAYRLAAHTLQTIRPEMTRGPAAASSFEEQIKPVYMGLVDLLLQRAARLPDAADAKPYLIEARETTESFKVAELQDYFRDECVDASRAQTVSLDTISPHVVVLYPIVLPDRIELLITLPNGLKRTTVPVNAPRLTEEARAFRRALEERTDNYLDHAQALYDWLIRPIDSDLASFNIDTLVFVPSGALLTVPMAALHDGQRFLIQKYAVAITPALKLTDPRPFPHDHVHLLMLALTESVQGFRPLPGVATEVKMINDLYGGTVLMNQDFRVPRIAQTMDGAEFNAVHIASHGVFGADVDNTFLLTFDGKLTMNALDQWVGLFKTQREPLELLAMSACETAAGDDRAALGLAGVAVKAGAKSALATLWPVDDRAAAFVSVEFYRNLRDPARSKAQALQRAQVELLEHEKFQHPGFWSPFLLINNWL